MDTRPGQPRWYLGETKQRDNYHTCGRCKYEQLP